MKFTRYSPQYIFTLKTENLYANIDIRKDEALRLRRRVFCLGYLALPLLVAAGAAFFIFEIVILIRFSVIVILINIASFH